MTDSLQKVIESRRALRRELASRPVAEKLRMLDAMRVREEAIRGRNQDDSSSHQLLTELLKWRRENWVGKGRYKEPPPPNTDGLPVLPTTWTWASTSQLSAGETHSLAIGPFGSDLKVSDYRGSGVPLVFVRNIRSASFANENTVYISEDKADALSGHQVAGGDLLVTKMGDPPGDACVYPEFVPTAVITADCIKLRLAPALTAKRFFMHAINSPVVRSQILAVTRGVAQKKISLERFKTIAIPLPPLSEQQRIVAKIEKQFTRLDAAVSALKRAQTNLQRFRRGILKTACAGGLVPARSDAAVHDRVDSGARLLEQIVAARRSGWNGRGKYKEPGQVNSGSLPPLPEGWVWASIEQVSTKVADGVHKKPTYVSEGIPFVTVRNLTAGPGISFEKLSKISPEDHEEFIRRADPQRGDILVSKDGTLGVVRVVKTDAIFSIFVSVALVKPVLREMSDYLGIALESPQVQAQMVPKGSGLQHIHLEDLRADCIPLPPLVEQKRIVAEVERRLSVVDELQSVVEANVQRAKNLRQSILQRAFSGNL